MDEYIHVDESGVAWTNGTTMKVKELVLDKMAYGWSPEEIHFQLPHLSLAQIHAALAFYYGHQEEIDSQIEHDYRSIESMRRRSTPPFTRDDLLKRLARTA